MRNIPLKIYMPILLAITTFAAFWGTLGNGFVNYDDPGYITENAHVLGGLSMDSIRWAFSTSLLGNWHPLTWISHLLDVQLFGLNPAGHHATSLLLHVLTTILLFLFLNRTTGSVWRSAVAAALFSLHPLRVESVAWVSERKDLLSGMLFMLTLLLYCRYTERPGLLRYVAVISVFALGLMAKPMLVSVPIVLLLLDWWPLRRLGPSAANGDDTVTASVAQLLVEKIPFFILSAAISIVTIMTQSAAKATMAVPDNPLTHRISNALLSYAAYLGKTFWPADLAVLYPLRSQVQAVPTILAALLLIIISILFVRHRRRTPFLLAGWLWFLVTLVPVIGIVQVGLQSMADRYTYIPSIGICIAVVWGIGGFSRGRRYAPAALRAIGVSVIAALIVITNGQIRHWHDSMSLFTHTLAVTENNYVAHSNLGDALQKQGRLDEAMQQYGAALKIRPDDAYLYRKIASVYDARGMTDDALKYYEQSLRFDSSNESAYNNIAIGHLKKGNRTEAIRNFMRAVQINPDLGSAHYNLGLALAEEGRMDDAISHYREALRINPDDTEVRRTLELVMQKKL